MFIGTSLLAESCHGILVSIASPVGRATGSTGGLPDE
jgi:hypothetical protein